MKLNLIFIVSFVIAGCTPSVRYTRQSTTHAPTSPTQIAKPAYRTPSESELKRVVESYLGTPYRYGGKSRSGLDCSGFVAAVFREVYGLNFSYSSAKMREKTTRISLSSARIGDLVFFAENRSRINHVGIYMGNGRFVHASSSAGVIYSQLDENYYKKRFSGFGRVSR